jgi:hypothetical protein
LVSSAFRRLKELGLFEDPVEKEVDANFIPWLLDQVRAERDRAQVAHDLTNKVVLKAFADLFKARIEADNKIVIARREWEAEQARLAEEARQLRIREDELLGKFAPYIVGEGLEEFGIMPDRDYIPAELLVAIREELKAKEIEDEEVRWEQTQAECVENAKARWMEDHELDSVPEDREEDCEAFANAELDTLEREGPREIEDADVLLALLAKEELPEELEGLREKLLAHLQENFEEECVKVLDPDWAPPGDDDEEGEEGGDEGGEEPAAE